MSLLATTDVDVCRKAAHLVDIPPSEVLEVYRDEITDQIIVRATKGRRFRLDGRDLR